MRSRGHQRLRKNISKVLYISPHHLNPIPDPSQPCLRLLNISFCFFLTVKQFLSDPGDLVRSLCPDVRHSLTKRPFVDLTDVTLADEDTNLILTDNANRAIQGNVAMQALPSSAHSLLLN